MSIMVVVKKCQQIMRTMLYDEHTHTATSTMKKEVLIVDPI